ncbi:MAG: hypothetical protein NTV34_20680, partial [Proteobacteria bacterium]|nr:hypothetical protein [Pseudomonadota bacterium]
LKYMHAYLQELPDMDIPKSDYIFSRWLSQEYLPESVKFMYKVLETNLANHPNEKSFYFQRSLRTAISNGITEVVDELAKLKTTISDFEHKTDRTSVISIYIYNVEKLNAQFIEYLVAKGAQKQIDLGKSPLDYLVDRYKDGQHNSEKDYIAKTGKWMMQVGFKLNHHETVPW